MKAEPFHLNAETAIFVCAGPSIDRLTAAAWEGLGRAGALISVNGALAAQACLEHGVRFQYAAAMDVAQGLAQKVPGFAEIWDTTSAWRVTAEGDEKAPAESYVVEVEYWSDRPREGYIGGSTAMVTGNWICNPWPEDGKARAEVEAVAERSGKPLPPRGFKRVGYVGLDMDLKFGGHARGAGQHMSGFSDSRERYERVCRGWRHFFDQGSRRGVRIVNMTPDTCLDALPRCDLPDGWVC